MERRPTNGDANKARTTAEETLRAAAELKHDVDLLLENIHGEIDRINRRLDRLERKVGTLD